LYYSPSMFVLPCRENYVLSKNCMVIAGWRQRTRNTRLLGGGLRLKGMWSQFKLSMCAQANSLVACLDLTTKTIGWTKRRSIFWMQLDLCGTASRGIDEITATRNQMQGRWRCQTYSCWHWIPHSQLNTNNCLFWEEIVM
jgi:hypothetical protein